MREIVTNWQHASSFQDRFGSDITATENFRGDLTYTLKADRLKEIFTALRDDFGFEMVMDLFGMDYSGASDRPGNRLVVVYVLYSLSEKFHLRIKALVPDSNPEIESLVEVYAMANWFEREAWDMFGIKFKGHPNLTRILCHGEFKGHPLRKDYPADKFQRTKKTHLSSDL